jgi:hypothetical protein
MASQSLEMVSTRSELEGGAARISELSAIMENLKSAKNKTSAKLEALSGEKNAALDRANELETQNNNRAQQMESHDTPKGLLFRFERQSCSSSDETYSGIRIGSKCERVERFSTLRKYNWWRRRR